MNEVLQLLKENGYLAVFLGILLDQLGLPLASVPILLAAGALVGMGALSFGPILAIVLVAALIGDLLWYELGRRKGVAVLKLLCRVSLEPETCIRSTENVFERYGVACLLFAKFVPGLYTVTPPVAGLVGLRLRKFLLFDSLGILIWATVYAGLGLAMSNQLEWVLGKLQLWGGSLAQLVLLLIGLNLLYKFVAKQLFIRKLRTARIAAEELKELLDSGADVLIADLRHSADIQSDPVIIPGAQVVNIDRLDSHADQLPRDREIILYCT